ncbi:2,4-dienoyl-CoA reductase-like NADH-dependent reductase (Old Yellow Enzyme family) [Psychromicrobium silvestre]|uniref:2,4-dienoyl-CoA reductase-like NADH-dependent reductase (Old Yellow Enzyme family) n=1 Tax=Psychromicrobium silvestre TaxID=1645614 RepID=A0A7Y9S593_9MICC|nr:2,4-dienoyl-CoA reductase-like NADH-dependent reductase (Old Yellow Enzyme family) [Psychromicrobium silvestre]
MSRLFDPLALRGLELSHRGWVSAMCQYSTDTDAEPAPGVPNDWHLMHLGQFAAGGAALIITEATAVVPEGRISPRDTGLYNDEQAEAWRRIIDFVHRYGAVDTKIGVQLAHAGRKASTWWPFVGQHGSVPLAEGGWPTLGPTDEAFPGYAAPRAMTEQDIQAVIDAFAQAARRAVEVGFDTIELHAAHGYLLHQFLSPVVNTRSDAWGGEENKRFRLVLEVIDAVRREIPDSMPLLLRVSASDWTEPDAPIPGLQPEALARLGVLAKDRGVDLIDVSSGGAIGGVKIPLGPGYQTGFAEQIKAQADIPVASVGLITAAQQADHVIGTAQADAIFIARAALRNPHWWQQAAHELGVPLPWAPQYERAATSGKY